MGYFLKKTCKALFLMDGRIKVLETMQYITLTDKSITVPEGFICDCASIPRFFIRLCGSAMHPKNLRAGIVHDYIYSVHMFDREHCDQIFYEILRSEGKSWIIAKLMYQAVRVFGESHY